MVVQVKQKRGQPRPPRPLRFSLLGDGLLERTRSTTFGLLGMIAAVGLGMIAVALPGGWPLVAGSPVPRAPVLHESVGDATALGPKAVPDAVHRPSARSQRSAVSHRAGSRHGGGAPAATAPVASTELVSSPATPVESPSGTHHNGGSHRTPAPGSQPPAASQPQSQQTPSAAQPATQPSHVPATPSSPAPAEPSQPEATASESPPVQSYTPSWSNGEGHAWGREDGDHGDDRGHGHDSTGPTGD
jgi:hypothetical protein